MTDAKIYELPDLGKPVEPLLRNVIGEVLRRTRLQQHRTLKDVADAAQVSIPYLSEIERGRKEASSEVLSAVCRSLGIGLLELIGSIHRQLWERRPALMLRSSGAGGPSISAPPCPTSRPGGFGPVQLLAA